MSQFVDEKNSVFLLFQSDICVEDVWKDLHCFHFRHDLRDEKIVRKEEEEARKKGKHLLPRELLTKNPTFFGDFYDHLLSSTDPRVVDTTWKLLLRLPTNPEMKQKFFDLYVCFLLFQISIALGRNSYKNNRHINFYILFYFWNISLNHIQMKLKNKQK